MRVIFQDIDGVLYPCFQRPAFKMNAERVKTAFVGKNSFFQDVPAYDLLAAYEGWDTEAMQRLQRLVKETDAKLVISSSWKLMRSLKTMQQLFEVYGLGKEVIALTPNEAGFLKEPAIQAYLEKHPEVTSYVVLDDINMEKQFPGHCVVCGDVFDEACYEKAKGILKGQEG